VIRALVVAVGKRTEHWCDFFAALARRRGLDVVLQAAEVSRLAADQLAQLAHESPRFRFRLAPHLCGEETTGHMASILFGPGSWRGLRNLRPDVVHVIGEPSYLATHQAIRARNRFWPGVPVTLYAAQNVVARFPWPFPHLERYAYRQAALALPITPAALAVLREKGYRGPARIVPLGVDLAQFAPAPSPPAGPFTVAFVGRLESHKGIADLVAACDLLECRLLIVGDGSLRPWVEAEAARRDGRIELRPWAGHAELPRFLARAHALALPSVEIVQRNVLPWVGVPLREQFGRVLVEAMACGVPVVGTTVGEIPHVLGEGGLTVPPSDPAALARALTAIRDDLRLAARLRERGLERAAEFSWDRIAESMEEAWAGVVAMSRALKRSGRLADSYGSRFFTVAKGGTWRAISPRRSP
jgi:glycosyltransferase involved in cell wall biosynthesis